MAETIRQLLLKNIGDTLAEISEIKTVQVQKFSPLELDTLPLPAAFVYAATEVRKDETSATEIWDFEVAVEVWAKEDELEQLLGLVHKKLYEDRRRGGMALKTERLDSSTFIVDPERSLGGILMTFLITYYNKLGDPYQQ